MLGHDDAVAAWAAERLGCHFSRPYVGIGRIDDSGTLVAAAVYTAYSHTNIELNLYAPNRAAQRHWWGYVAYTYPFEEIGVLRVTMRTRRSNKVTRRLLERFGVFEGVQRRFYGPTRADDAFTFGVFPERMETYGRR